MLDPLENSFAVNEIICRICLVNNLRMYNIDKYNLINYYEDIVNKKELSKNLPNYLCNECAILLLKYHKFRLKCERGQKCFGDFLKHNISHEDAEMKRKEFNLISTLNIREIKVDYYFESNIEPNETEYDEDDTEFNTNDLVNDKHESNLKLNEIKIKDSLGEKVKKDKMKLTNIAKGENKIRADKNKIRLDLRKWRRVELNEHDTFLEFNRRGQKYQNSLYSCDLCYHGFSNKVTLERHMAVHSEDRGLYECTVCKKRFRWQTKLKCHMLEHTVSYHCLKCPKICVSLSQVKVHEKYHDGIDYVCKVCGAKFLKMSTYYSHVRLKHPSTFICNSCGSSFVSETGLSQHKTRVHTHKAEISTENLNCLQCNVTFDNRKAFQHHMEHHHGNNEKEKEKLKSSEEMISCNNCEQRFKSSNALRRHEKSVHSTKMNNTRAEYVCEICGASVARSSIWQHRNSHTRQTVFPCSVCSRRFHTPANRHRHMVTHTGEKPFACKLCDKRFTQRTNLKLHFNTYHLKQPYPYERNRGRKQERPA